MITRRASAALLVVLLFAGAMARAAAERSGNVAGEFDYFTLVLSWSPTHCSSQEGRDDYEQCDGSGGRRYGFVLHGLWPQYEEGFPEGCPTRRRPYVAQEIIDGMLDIMPSKGLIIHEYRAHGTCSGLDPKDYFDLSRRLFEKLVVPDRFENPFETQFLSPDELVDELVAVNPGLRPDMVAVSCGGPGNRLQDVRICFTRGGDPKACGDNEDQSRLCRAQSMHVPPVRSNKVGRASPEERSRRPPEVPRPRLIETPNSR
jgi:ribonuclease T2